MIHRTTNIKKVFTELHWFQASKFVQRFHQERKTKLSLILDSERWKQADVPEEFQRLVTHIIDTGKLCHLSFWKWGQNYTRL